MSCSRPMAGVVACLLALGLTYSPLCRSADWPTYGGDSKRSCVSPETLKPPFSSDWVFVPVFPPSHAWGDPQPKPVEGNLELPRLRFDDAYHVAVAGGLVLFGSSSDTKVYALDLATGSVRWEFLTGGPVRFAPTIADGRAYVGSDDGNVYCLDLGTGREVWHFAAAPAPDKILGNGQMISVWPVRTGVLVDGGIAYFGAGVFPAEGLYLYAVDAGTGTLVWKNDSYDRGGKAEISPQGYLLLSKDKIFVPSARSMPVAFARDTGRYLYQRNQSWRAIGLFGGTYCLLAEDMLFNGTEQILGANQSDGNLVLTEAARRIVVGQDKVFFLTGTQLVAVERKPWLEVTRKRLPHKRRIISLGPQLHRLKVERDRAVRAKQTPPADLLKQIEQVQKDLDAARATDGKLEEELKQRPASWRAECSFTDSLVVTASVVVAGGDGGVQVFARSSGDELWRSDVDGTARGLAMADGRLVVSTDTGRIHCFVSGNGGKGRTVTREPSTAALSALAQSPAGRRAAAAVQRTGVERGYALVVGPDADAAAAGLVSAAELSVIVAEPDAARLQATRRKLDVTGIYGGRVVALRASLAPLPFADYFANLVYVQPGGNVPAPEEALRVLKPCGGVAVVSLAAGAVEQWSATLRQHLVSAGETETSVRTEEGVVIVRRGRLPDTADWTHQYADPGNTGGSTDRRVKGPLGVLWFGEPGPGRMPSRHASAAAPLAVGGRMFAQGENVVMAYDSYNGVHLWTRDIAGAMRLGLKNRASNLAANREALFVVAQGKCLRLDLATGKTVQEYSPPPAGDAVPAWGEYLACSEDILWGSHSGNTIFALDFPSGRPLWTHKGSEVRLATLAVDGGRLFYVDRAADPEQQKKALVKVDQKLRTDRRGKPIPADVRVVVCLDAKTGKTMWESPQYVSDCVKIGPGGGELTLMASKGVVMLCGQPWNGHFWKEFFAGDFSRRSLIALSATDGYQLWSGRRGYRSRPLILGDMVIAEPWAYDLHTGAEHKRIHPLTGGASKWQVSRPGHHCGNIVASPNMMFFRSGSLAYYDLTGDTGTTHFGAQRTGCWINCIPANGIVLMPEASSGCVCPFPIHCTTVFYPHRRQRGWQVYSAAGDRTPVKRLGINFAAPGDRKAADGTLWLAHPRPGTDRLVLDLKLDVQVEGGGGTFCEDASFFDIAGTDLPWLFASGYRGLSRCTVPLVGRADGHALYTVRLFLADTENDAPGARRFDIELQGEKVATDLDVIAEAGGPRTALVKEFHGVLATDSLELKLKTKAKEAAPAQRSLIQAMEIVREKVLHVGLFAPSCVVSDLEPEKKGQVEIANHTESAFAGKLVLVLDARFSVVPAETPVSLACGERTSVPIVVRVAAKGEPTTVPLTAKLVRTEGTVETTRQAEVQYLGPRGRVVVMASGDSYVSKGNPGGNNGHAPTMAVDGGAAEMGDHSHNVGYLRFPLNVPGRTVSVVLRLYVPVGGHTQSFDSGVVKLVEGVWDERTINQRNAPAPGRQIGVLGKVDQGKWEERKLDIDLSGRTELSIALDPTSCDGATFVSREGPEKPQLVIEYEQAQVAEGKK